MGKVIRIGTRESQLAVWQATLVQQLLAKNNFESQLIFIKSEGDIDLQTPLYEMGIQGVFTKSLDIALLTGKIDIAVHSMKDVPTQLAKGIIQSAVLERASHKDIFVFKDWEIVNSWHLKEPAFSPPLGDGRTYCDQQHSPKSTVAKQVSRSCNRKSQGQC